MLDVVNDKGVVPDADAGAPPRKLRKVESDVTVVLASMSRIRWGAVCGTVIELSKGKVSARARCPRGHLACKVS